MTFWYNETNLNDTIKLLDDENEIFDILSETDSYAFDPYALKWIIPVSIAYVIIFITGLLGNISTCLVIVLNKPLHTPSNYYLFSLAISDMLILVSALFTELLGIWLPQTYIFGKTFCIFQMFFAETSANATILTVTAVTIERYIAICHPFLSHITSKLSRTVKFIIGIWIIASCMALPAPIGLINLDITNLTITTNMCGIQDSAIHSVEVSVFVFFVCPMILISVLYILIVINLKKSKFLTTHGSSEGVLAAHKRVIKMLVAVVIAFFVCWAPFHIQRLMVIYSENVSGEDSIIFLQCYVVVLHLSGISYYISTAINPILYNIMSSKFRKAFKTTFTKLCNKKRESDAKKLEGIQITIVESLPELSSDGADNRKYSTEKISDISSDISSFTISNIKRKSI